VHSIRWDPSEGYVVDAWPLELAIEHGKRSRTVSVEWTSGHRFPHLDPESGGRRHLDDILSPLSG